MPDDLTGRTALVTGASGGIGAAIARRLHALGAAVVLSGRRRETLESLAADLGEAARVVVAELGTAEAARALAKAAGDVDIIVNNAGVVDDSLALRLGDDQWQRVIDLDLSSAFHIIQPLLRGMIRRRHGRIINITSVVGHTGNPGQANYAAAKAGLAGMTRSLALEVAQRGITVNCVAPGFIDTAMTDQLPDSLRDSILDRIPAGRLGTADDVAAAVAWLAGDDAAYVTGQTIHVNGGMAMP
ncbi:MAG: 3-oxoacyl-ACP reductase FabG [bacterium]|nr:3-oxoacyl-ACP reductase FabG [bacterium]MDE0418548.1 3-oxoacyl-ACP reductase FabG [bacterium]